MHFFFYFVFVFDQVRVVIIAANKGTIDDRVVSVRGILGHRRNDAAAGPPQTLFSSLPPPPPPPLRRLIGQHNGAFFFYAGSRPAGNERLAESQRSRSHAHAGLSPEHPQLVFIT